MFNLRRLSTPNKIQDFLDRLPINFETRGDKYLSPRSVLRQKRADCFEGALVAAAALWRAGEPPLLLDLQTAPGDEDHVVALFKRGGRWGAISKTNHAALRFRDPLYRSVRELAASYFHEYFLNKNGQKTLRRYSRPFDLRRFGEAWLTDDAVLPKIAVALDHSPHYALVPPANLKSLRPASQLERQAGRLTEW